MTMGDREIVGPITRQRRATFSMTRRGSLKTLNEFKGLNAKSVGKGKSDRKAQESQTNGNPNEKSKRKSHGDKLR